MSDIGLASDSLRRGEKMTDFNLIRSCRDVQLIATAVLALALFENHGDNASFGVPASGQNFDDQLS